jgi:hypothetical protein
VFSYRAYGLTLRSSLPLPELTPSGGTPDVDIKLAKLIQPSSATITPQGSRWATPGEIFLSFHHVGSFLARSGCALDVDLLPTVDEDIGHQLVLGPGLGAILLQRGLLVLHASAVAIHGHAVILIGGSGWGKSSTAAALFARGHGLMADDVVPIAGISDGQPTIAPGYPQVKLWPDVAAACLGSDVAASSFQSETGKYLLPTGRGFPASALPLACIYVLDEGSHLEVASLTPREALLELLRHSYSARLLEPTGTAAAHFTQSGELAKQVPVFRLYRERSLAELNSVARLVENHVIQQVEKGFVPSA